MIRRLLRWAARVVDQVRWDIRNLRDLNRMLRDLDTDDDLW